jgi:hypothetical protein
MFGGLALKKKSSCSLELLAHLPMFIFIAKLMVGH